MQKHLDDELKILKERLLEMGSLAERNVHRAIDMFVMRDVRGQRNKIRVSHC